MNSVYFTSMHCVFKVDVSGTVTRIAGIARQGYAGDGGPATAAQLNTPNRGKNLGRAVYHCCAAADGCALPGATRSRVLLKMALGLWCVQRVATDVIDWDFNEYAATGK